MFLMKPFCRACANGFKNSDWVILAWCWHKEKFITDMFMTPKWEKSKRAKDEHKIARKCR
jgi:hypothetical protein